MADEIPEAVLDTAAAALVNFSLGARAYDTLADFQRTHWRKALAAALPPLVAERDAEITRLRAENEQLRRITAEVSRLRWLVDEDGPVMHALGQIEAMTARLEGVTDTARLLDFAEVEQVYRIAGDAIAALRETPAPSTTAEERQA